MLEALPLTLGQQFFPEEHHLCKVELSGLTALHALEQARFLHQHLLYRQKRNYDSQMQFRLR